VIRVAYKSAISNRSSAKRYVAPCAAVLFLLLGGLRSASQAPNAAALAHAVDQHYNNLKSFKAEFVETYQGPGVSRTESGVLWLKKPGKMRWEYREPTKKLFLSDSHTAYFYVPGERQARTTSIKKLDDLRSPLRFLLGKAKLNKELDGLSLAPDVKPVEPGDWVLRGIPHGMKDRISEVLLEVNPAHQLVRIMIQEIDGTTTDFHFSRIEENVPVADSQFHFAPPPGVEIIHENGVAQ
jgi:outer membrane lipoprotein carrier protein